MRLDPSDPDAIVGRSREIAEERWPDIKGELDDVKAIPVVEIAACTPLRGSEDGEVFASRRRRFKD